MKSRIQPQSKELERAVLGALMIDKDSMYQVSALLSPEDFYQPKNQIIYKSITELNAKASPIDLLTVHEYLKSSGELERVGGINYLMELSNEVASSANIEYHARIIQDNSVKRKMITSLTGVISDCFNNESPVGELLTDLDLSTLLYKNKINGGKGRSKDEVIKNVIKEVSSGSTDGISGMKFTGVKELDEMLNGANGGELIILAARPSMGKSMMANTMFKSVTYDQKKSGCFWGLEMNAEENLKMYLSSINEIGYNKHQRGEVDVTDNRFSDSIDHCRAKGIIFDDKMGVNAMDIRSALTTYKNIHDIQFAVIDHGGLMKHNLGGKENETIQIGRSSMLLKQTAKELNIPIVLLWQLSRSVETRGGEPKPRLSDLRQSGRLEEDADKVIFLYRPEYYGNDFDDEGETKGIGYAIVAKNRKGLTGEVRMRFDPNNARYVSLNDSVFDEFVTEVEDPFSTPMRDEEPLF